jgi:hypothetical protein
MWNYRLFPATRARQIMKAFFVRWRSARQFREYELFADEEIGACLIAALKASGGMAVWETGTLWKCPGCGDRTLRTEEFLEGLRRAEEYLRNTAGERAVNSPTDDESAEISNPIPAVLDWLERIAAQMFGCERDRVYIKDEGTTCRYAGETYISRI